MSAPDSQPAPRTIEKHISHPYRYGSIVRRTGRHSTSWRVKLRREPGGSEWRTCTRHTYAEACAVLEQWNAEYEAQFLDAHPISRYA